MFKAYYKKAGNEIVSDNAVSTDYHNSIDFSEDDICNPSYDDIF